MNNLDLCSNLFLFLPTKSFICTDCCVDWDLMVVTSQAEFRVETGGGAVAFVGAFVLCELAATESYHHCSLARLRAQLASSCLKLVLLTRDVFALRASFLRNVRLFSRHCSER